MRSNSRTAEATTAVSHSEPAPDRLQLSEPRPDRAAPVSRLLPGVEELKLIHAAHRGDRAAFQTIVETHQGAIYGYLRSRLLEPADAEDLTQEVFLRSYVGHARFEGAVMIRPWLLGIARNLLREHARKIKRRKEVAWTELCLRLEEDLIETHNYEDVMAHLPVCLGSLGQSARQALDLRYQARLRLSEIGEKLHRSEGAVKLLMFRARQALKRCLDAKIVGCIHD
jgi:RNA polymerase sigma-70 factor (ECF subfamily)